MNENDNGWINNPALKNIDINKLQMLLTLADQGKNKSPGEMLPFLLSVSNQAKNSGKSFSADETDLILNVLKQGKSAEEIAKIDKMAEIVKKMKAGR